MITSFSVCRQRYLFRRYSRSKCEVVRNRPTFWTFLPSKILWVQAHQISYPYSHACLAARYVEKFREVIFLGPKVITANTLNFQPIFELSLLEIVRERFLPSQILGVGASPLKVLPKLSHFPRGTSSVKVSRCYSRWPRVITANTLHFKLIFKCLLLKIVGRPPSLVGCTLASLGHSLARVKILAGSTP